MIETTAYIDYLHINIIKLLNFFQNSITYTGSLRNVGLCDFGT
jgi:hypothetical protein